MERAYKDVFVRASDGLRLYGRDYGPAESPHYPVICLPGLTRHSADFHCLALALSQDPHRPRRVLALDYRGRGRSEWAQDWHQYDVRVECEDVLRFLAETGIDQGIFVGTSRGGLIIMALAATQPALLKSAVLNDIGPVIEAEGLKRIRSYVGKLSAPRDWAEGGRSLRQIFEAQFPNRTDAQWEDMARRIWFEEQGKLVLAYDPNLMKPLEALDLDQALPNLWSLFEALTAFPVLVIRGENSDLLSEETLARMQALHARLSSISVPDQGHAPELEGDLIAPIADFIAGIRP